MAQLETRFPFPVWTSTSSIASIQTRIRSFTRQRIQKTGRMFLTPTLRLRLWTLDGTARAFPFSKGEKSGEDGVAAASFGPRFRAAEVVYVVAFWAVPNAVLVSVAWGDGIEAD
jgi:hypothetical protein